VEDERGREQVHRDGVERVGWTPFTRPSAKPTAAMAMTGRMADAKIPRSATLVGTGRG